MSKVLLLWQVGLIANVKLHFWRFMTLVQVDWQMGSHQHKNDLKLNEKENVLSCHHYLIDIFRGR